VPRRPTTNKTNSAGFHCFFYQDLGLFVGLLISVLALQYHRNVFFMHICSNHWCDAEKCRAEVVALSN